MTDQLVCGKSSRAHSLYLLTRKITMRQFLKFMLASVVGTFIAGMLLFFFVLLMISSTVSSLSTKQSADVSSNSVLRIRFAEEIKERSDDNPFKNFDLASFESEKSLGLDDILKDIKKAKTDDRIKGIFLELESIDGGIATINSIRRALIDFKQS